MFSACIALGQQRTWFARRGVLRPRRICSAASHRLLSTLSALQRSIRYRKLDLREKRHLQIVPVLLSYRMTYLYIISIRVRLGVFGKEVGAVA